MRGQPCTDHLGREYPSRLARAKAWGISPVTVDQRIAAGWSVERALTSPPSHSPAPHPVTYRGTEYASVRAMCRELGLDRLRVRQALIEGATIDVAVLAGSARDVDRWARVGAVLDLWRARRGA